MFRRLLLKDPLTVFPVYVMLKDPSPENSWDSEKTERVADFPTSISTYNTRDPTKNSDDTLIPYPAQLYDVSRYKNSCKLWKWTYLCEDWQRSETN